jgi:broad specificity phosphatase PhoE
MLLYVIRHGQTDYNREERLQGARDIPLNDKGRGQAIQWPGPCSSAARASARCVRLGFKPLGRTRETMELVRTAAGLSPSAYRTDPLLIELSFGDWEGQTLAEVGEHSPQLIEERERGKWSFRPPAIPPKATPCWPSARTSFWHTGPAHNLRRPWRRDPHSVSTAIGKIDIPQDRILKIDGDQIGWI